MKLFKKRSKNKPNKILNDIVWARYLNARSMEDQTLAKQIAEEYGIDYDCFPILDNNIVNKIHEEIARVKHYERQKETKKAVREVLIENRLIVN